MKETITLLLALLYTSLLLAKPYTQQGIAYLYDYKTKTRKPVANVSITVVGAQPTISKDDGTFTLVFDSYGLGDKVSFEKQPYYQGMKVFNKKEVDNWYIVKDRLRLIMCRYEEFELAKNNFYQQGLRAATANYEREISQIKADLRLKEAEKNQKLQEAEEQLQQVMELLSETSETMARIDQSELDNDMKEVLDLYEKDNVKEAMKKLEEMKLNEKFHHSREKIHTGKRMMTEGTEDSLSILNAIRTQIEIYKNNGNWDKAAEDLKMLADSLNTYEDVFTYAYFCHNQKDFKDAEIYYEKTLEIRQRLANNNPKAYEPDVAQALHRLALLYSDTQRFIEAEEMYEQALVIRQRLAMDNPKAYEPDVATTLNNLAILYFDTQRLTEAEKIFKQALEIRQQLAKDNPKAYESDMAETLNNLAILYENTQRLTEAEEMYKQALEIWQRLAKDNPKAYEPSMAMTLYNLAILYYKIQRLTEAEEMYKKALEILQRLTKDNPKAYETDMAMTMNSLAVLYSETQRFTEAEEMQKKVLEIYQRLTANNPKAYEPDLAMTLYNLANLYSKTQRLTEAEIRYKQTLEICQRLAKDSPKAFELYVAQTLNGLAALYKNTQRLTEAEEMYKKALEIWQRLAKDNPKAYEPYVAATQYQIGLLLIKKEQYTDAITSFEEVLEIYGKLAKGDSSLQEWIFNSLYYLSQLYSQTNNHKRNYEIQQELLPLLKEMYETDAENIRNTYVTTIGNQSFYAIIMEKYSEAEQLAYDGLKVDSTKHFIYTNLAAALLLQGRYSEAEPIYRQYKDELKDSFLDDFEQFKATGVIPKEREEDMEKIKRMLEE